MRLLYIRLMYMDEAPLRGDASCKPQSGKSKEVDAPFGSPVG
jgi:hypothetical protein